MPNPVGRSPIYPKENCSDCDYCIYDKNHKLDTCIFTFNFFEARKNPRCENFTNEHGNPYRKKKVIKTTKKLRKIKRKREI